MLSSDSVGKSDIVISCGSCALPSHSTKRVGPYLLHGSTLYFQAEGVAVYRCDAGKSIVVDVAPEATDAAVSGLLIATALPALLWMRGDTVLHAAAFALPGADRAIAIMGPSGIGKSTMLEQAVALGASVIADDTLCVRTRDGKCWVSGLPGGYFASDGTGGRTFHPISADRQIGTMPLGSIVLLSETAGGPGGALAPTGALTELLRARHRPRAVAILGQDGPVLERLATLAERVPVYRWNRSRGAVALGHDLLALQTASGSRGSSL